ncbi:hypothetical protein WJX81_005211 [Elliptochloris bilobata]|uniref:Mannosyltransferase n=1 Tax=Elliptochloris bilobata TaxID=381761 RepID=A0AAW1SJN7_9CHLO
MATRPPEGNHTQQKPRAPVRGLSTGWAFLLLLASRLISARVNLIHDCDEVYNYWEPLHFLLYGSGMQTWEYSSKYALRSYLYLLLHATVAGPAALLFGTGAGKVWVFYATKAGLATLSALCESALYRATREAVGGWTAHLLLALLASSAGMFVSASGLLPSAFAMCCLTAAAAAVLAGRPLRVIVAGAAGLVWGWPVAGVSFLPYAVYVLLAAPLGRALGTAAAALAFTAGPLVITDRVFYGRWTVSLLNFLRYNVGGGGNSALYGTEGAGFYLRSGALALNLALPLAAAAPLALLFRRGHGRPGGRARMAVALAPVPLWLAAISALPHKEERFLYVVYPLVCLAAAVALAATPAALRALGGWLLPRRATLWAAWLAPRAALTAAALLSAMRVAALVRNYGAPMALYRQLPELLPGANTTYVCVGGEWHRFPSAFFLPGPAYRLAYVRSGFDGLLPRAFDLAQGGTAAAPPELNDRNRWEPRNAWADALRCDFFVGLQHAEEPALQDPAEWSPLAARAFVDTARSPSALARALYIPRLSAARNLAAQCAIE